MHFTIFGLFLLASRIECIPRLDPVAYHQSIFKHTTFAPPKHVDNEPVQDSKTDPLQLFMRFFNNAPFMKTMSEMFDQPTKQKLQAAPKSGQTRPIKIAQFNGQTLQQNDAPVNGQFSIDEPAQIKDQTTENFDWKHLLLGRDGLLTSIFNEFKERRKMELGKVKPNVPQADLTPEQNNFAKIFEAFMTKGPFQAGTHPYFEQTSLLPPGMLFFLKTHNNDVSLDDYLLKLIELNTVMSLLHDPKGLDIIGDVLANPDLIENFVNGKNGGTLPEVASAAKISNKTTRDEVTKEDGDFGIDFSAIEDGKPIVVEKKLNREMPLISANMDYYSSVDNNEDKVEKEERIPDHIDVEESVDTNQTKSLPALPEISESIDAVPQDYNVAIEETIHIPMQETLAKEVTASRPTINSRTTTRQSSTSRPTTTTSIYTTTKRNFRIKDPLYAMYYDI